MSFSVRLVGPAKRELTRLSRDVQERIAPVLRDLRADPFPMGYKKLKGNKGYRVRVGDYRVLYDVNTTDRSVIIYAIAHRKDAY